MQIRADKAVMGISRVLEMDTKYCRSTSPTVLDKHAALRSGQRLVRGMLSALLCLGSVATAQERPAPAAQPHPLAQEMFKQGAISCASTAHQLASLLSNGKETSLLQVFPNNPDGALASGTFVQPNDTGTALIGMSFAPNQQNGCSASYRMIVYIDDRCTKAADKNYPGQKPQTLGKTGVLLLNPGPRVQALLVPTGKGCLIVSEELVR